MIFTFWITTVLLLISALGFVLPWIGSWRIGLLVVFFTTSVAYGLYFYQGSSQYLAHYYSSEEQLHRVKQAEFRKLLTAFKKQEFRLRIRLEENPKDTDAEWKLLDLLAIKALQNGDKKLAAQYWETALNALNKIPKNSETLLNRNRIANLIEKIEQ